MVRFTRGEEHCQGTTSDIPYRGSPHPSHKSRGHREFESARDLRGRFERTGGLAIFAREIYASPNVVHESREGEGPIRPIHFSPAPIKAVANTL